MSSIDLNNVCLDYIVMTGYGSLKRSVLNGCRSIVRKSRGKSAPAQAVGGHSLFRALNNIDLKINKGDRVGLIGHNGAGKSTLLRVIAKIYKPGIGSVSITGKTSSLFDVNLGLNLEATGYENIINLGIMRGWSKKAAQSIVEDVKAFTELDSFLDKPVYSYSNGMQMKLAFAVATAIAPEIILIDEVIGVGDAHFMMKAKQRITNLIDKSHILVLTSHSNDIIRDFCNKVVVLEHGEIKFFGDTESGIRFYEEMTR